jgi:hypothetical protein
MLKGGTMTGLRLLLLTFATAALAALPFASSALAMRTTAAASPIFCDTSLDDFVNSTLHIATITSNNEANLKQYRQAVAEAATTEKHIVWTKVTSDCLARVGKPAENALKLYTAGEAPWTACASKGSCKTATPPTADNAAFKKASRMIHAAYNSLD